MSVIDATPATHLTRPRRAPGTEIHPPASAATNQWMLQRGPKYVRVGEHVARLAEQLDGAHDNTELAERMGWSPAVVSRVVAQLDGLGLIDDGTMTAPGRPRLLQIVPPFTIQLTLLRPGRTMQRLRPAFAVLASSIVGYLALLVGVAGLAALAVQAGDVRRALGEPLPFTTYAGMLAALLVATSIHELGHAAMLIRYGGKPSRIGIMLFYFLPAFFCDVSDAWRLPDRGQRVRVALAGPAVQAFLGSLAALTALTVEPSDLKVGMVFFAVGSYVTSVLNLLPLVKLDGYIALMSLVDVPFLRGRAIADARRALARGLFGGTYPRELTTRWTVWYGLACLAFPAYLLATAGALWVDLLQRAGVVGLSIVLLGLCYAGYLLGRGIRRMAAEMRAAGVRRGRVVGVTSALLLAAGAAMFAPVPYSVEGAYVTEGGQVRLVLPDSADVAMLAPGQRVDLLSNGAVLRSELGQATVADDAGAAGSAPLSSFFPIRIDPAVQLPVTGYALDVTDAPDRPTAAARVHAGELPLWELAYRSYVRPFM
ncbi:daptide biosynthesis intramembrane metalloprotease [Actinoplanes sp. NPDC051859]|uniref:daptide biosynthesis intramembrane metalloprotease n=1 Tax=Actinoplanes sp. NPDC051859 TaxID=3363909 RepID=UPI00379A0FEE